MHTIRTHETRCLPPVTSDRLTYPTPLIWRIHSSVTYSDSAIQTATRFFHIADPSPIRSVICRVERTRAAGPWHAAIQTPSSMQTETSTAARNIHQTGCSRFRLTPRAKHYHHCRSALAWTTGDHVTRIVKSTNPRYFRSIDDRRDPYLLPALCKNVVNRFLSTSNSVANRNGNVPTSELHEQKARCMNKT